MMKTTLSVFPALFRHFSDGLVLSGELLGEHHQEF